MNKDIYQVIQSMQTFVMKQNETLRSLQKQINSLEKKVKKLEARPPVHVEKMEYKFDQLKVETLEGTLNIGLNPADLQGIDDLSIAEKPTTVTPQERMHLVTDIETSLREYLETNLQSIIEDAAQQLHQHVNESYHDFIFQDIKKQLPNRIEFYLNQPPARKDEAAEQRRERILESLKKEIHQGVVTFLQHLPENMKGTKKE
ncbi:spore germination protein GerPC [Bacillus tuaregi]|uniref:spore germination protein GerPC n=1 Tax=Bacillus tuaregi TaxID=1816695 RepID=UPI0008F8D76A|nr:spore germination protein GerPC [Bacillus tuaregi]